MAGIMESLKIWDPGIVTPLTPNHEKALNRKSPKIHVGDNEVFGKVVLSTSDIRARRLSEYGGVIRAESVIRPFWAFSNYVLNVHVQLPPAKARWNIAMPRLRSADKVRAVASVGAFPTGEFLISSRGKWFGLRSHRVRSRRLLLAGFFPSGTPTYCHRPAVGTNATDASGSVVTTNRYGVEKQDGRRCGRLRLSQLPTAIMRCYVSNRTSTNHFARHHPDAPYIDGVFYSSGDGQRGVRWGLVRWEHHNRRRSSHSSPTWKPTR